MDTVGIAGRVVAAWVTLSLIGAASAMGAPPWSEPRTLGSPVAELTAPAITFDSSGTAVISWHEQDPARSRLVTVGGDGVVVDRPDLPGDLVAPPVVLGHGRLALLRERTLSSDPDTMRTRQALSVSFGTTGAPSGGPTRRLAVFNGTTGAPRVAIAAHGGDLAVAWVEDVDSARRPEGRIRVRLAVRHHGRAFTVRTIAVRDALAAREGSAAAGVALAWGADGRLVIAYAAGHVIGGRHIRRVEARLRRASATLERAQDLGPGASIVDIKAAVAPSGRAVVLWGGQNGGEEATPYIVRAALRPAGARRFHSPQLLDPGAPTTFFISQQTAKPVALGIAPDGTATAAWTNLELAAGGHSSRVRAAVARSPARFGPTLELSAHGATGDVAVAPDATTAVAWRDYSGTLDQTRVHDDTVLVAWRPAGATAFAPPESVSSNEALPSPGPQLAFDPAGPHAATTVWPSSGPPFSSANDQPAHVLRIAARATAPCPCDDR
jgi:hypothetical protein